MVKEGDGEECDEELGEIQPALLQRGALAKSYTAWLRLMVAHFDATEIVVHYLQKIHCHTVSVDILLAPATDQTLLPWQDLFSGQYLPNRDSGSSRDIPSHNDICLFLEEHVSRAVAKKNNFQLAETALKHWVPLKNPKNADAKRILNKLHEDSNIKGQVSDILMKISEWEQMPQVRGEIQNRAAMLRVISDAIKDLKVELHE